MRTDTLFYQFSAARPAELARLLGLEPSLPWHFESINVKRLERQIDGMLFCAQAPAGPIFIEFQGYLDAHFYWRVFNEVTAYWMSRKPQELEGQAFQIYVIFLEEAHDPGNSVLVPVPPHSLHKITLEEALKGVTEPGLLVVLEPLTLPDVETLHVRIPVYRAQIQQLRVSEAERTVIAGLLIQAILTRFPSLNREEVQQMITLTPLRETRVFQEFGEEFRAEGRKEGIQEGLVEKGRQAILKVWTHRFGQPVDWVKSRISRCSNLELLDSLLDQVLDAASVEEAQTLVKTALGNGG